RKQGCVQRQGCNAIAAERSVQCAISVETGNLSPLRNSRSRCPNLSIRLNGHPDYDLVDITTEVIDNYHAAAAKSIVERAVSAKADQTTLVTELPGDHDFAVTL